MTVMYGQLAEPATPALRCGIPAVRSARVARPATPARHTQQTAHGEAVGGTRGRDPGGGLVRVQPLRGRL
jgi:hypothetical protein